MLLVQVIYLKLQHQYPAMNSTFLNKSFPLLDSKKDRYFLILFCFAFSVLFINLFVPFNINRWFSDSALVQFLRLSSYGFVVALVLLFSQFPLRNLFGVNSFSIKSFALWFTLEISTTSLVYIFLYGNPLGNFVNDFFFSLRYTFLGIALPYSVALLIIYYKTQRSELKELKGIKIETSGLVSFKDEYDKIRFSAPADHIIMLESTDNYVSVYYLANGKEQRTLVRNSLKNLESELAEKGFIRCHRSFIVNSRNIGFVEKKGKKILIRMQHADKVIPVSEKYSSRFLSFLS
jgi:hypothetical protein